MPFFKEKTMKYKSIKIRADDKELLDNLADELRRKGVSWKERTTTALLHKAIKAMLCYASLLRAALRTL